MSSSRLLLAPSALLTIGLLAACGGTGDTATNAGSSRSPSPSLTNMPGETSTSLPRTPPTTPDAEPEPKAPSPRPTRDTSPASDNAFVNRCAPRGAARSQLDALAPRTTTIKDESGSRLPVTVAGKGDTVLVVLHDAKGDACSAGELLAAAGADERFRVVAVDLCLSAAASCVGELMLDDVAQTGVVLDWVRERYEPTRLVVLGVGSGGTVAVRAAGVGLPADAVVNVSGAAPAEAIRRVTVPMLHVHEDLSGADASGARRVAAEGQRKVALADASATGWAALTGRGVELTEAGREALRFAAR